MIIGQAAEKISNAILRKHPEGGERIDSFIVNDKISSEEANQSTVAFHLQKDEELNLHQQHL